MANIEEIRNLAEPLKGYQFKVVIADPPGEGAGADLLQFRCTAAALPGKDIEEVIVNLDGFNVKYAGRSIPIGTWTVTFVEGTDLQVIQRMHEWQELCHNQASGVQADHSEYKRTARMELLDNEKETTLVRRLVGIWPQSVPDMPFDSTSSEAMRLDVTFAFDYFEDIS